MYIMLSGSSNEHAEKCGWVIYTKKNPGKVLLARVENSKIFFKYVICVK